MCELKQITTKYQPFFQGLPKFAFLGHGVVIRMLVKDLNVKKLAFYRGKKKDEDRGKKKNWTRIFPGQKAPRTYARATRIVGQG